MRPLLLQQVAMINLVPGVEHDEHGGAKQDDAPDAGHRWGQGQCVHKRVSQGEDGQCLPGLIILHCPCDVDC